MLPSSSGTSKKTGILTRVASVFPLGYFIWFAEETISTEETAREEDGHESGGDVSHPGGRQALGVLWKLLSAAYSRKKSSRQGDILQPAQPKERRQLCVCYRGRVCFTLFLYPVPCFWYDYRL